VLDVPRFVKGLDAMWIPNFSKAAFLKNGEPIVETAYVRKGLHPSPPSKYSLWKYLGFENVVESNVYLRRRTMNYVLNCSHQSGK
jgi:hypothetical protein